MIERNHCPVCEKVVLVFNYLNCRSAEVEESEIYGWDDLPEACRGAVYAEQNCIAFVKLGGGLELTEDESLQ